MYPHYRQTLTNAPLSSLGSFCRLSGILFLKQIIVVIWHGFYMKKTLN